jgi:Flp pilus assembly protein TadG
MVTDMRDQRRKSRMGSERGQALLEAALITPVVLLIMVGIFEVGRAFQTYQVVTNAAREGARAAVVPGADPVTVKGIVKKYMEDGRLAKAATAEITVNQAASIDVNGTSIGATLVTVDYPFEFVVLQPVAQLVKSDSTAGQALTMRSTSLMRNEAQ